MYFLYRQIRRFTNLKSLFQFLFDDYYYITWGILQTEIHQMVYLGLYTEFSLFSILFLTEQFRNGALSVTHQRMITITLRGVYCRQKYTKWFI